jgi:hypothetical protein
MASGCVDLWGVSCLKIDDPYRDGFCAPEQLVAKLTGTIDGTVGVWRGETTADGRRIGWGDVELCPGREVRAEYGEDGKATLVTSVVVAYDTVEDEFRTETGGRYRARTVRGGGDGPVPRDHGWRGERMVREEGGGYVTVDERGENHGPWWTEINSPADKGSEPRRSRKRSRDGADERDLEPKAPKSETEEQAEGGVSD